MNWQNVTDAHGVPIALMGMLIVFAALGLITAFLYALPQLLAAIEPYYPSVEEHAPAAPAVTASSARSGATGEIVAALAAVAITRREAERRSKPGGN